MADIRIVNLTEASTTETDDYVMVDSVANGARKVPASGIQIPATSIQAIGSNKLIANIAGGSASPTDVSITQALDSMLGNTRGALVTRTATGWVKLDPGTSGYFLKSQGSGSDLAYFPVPGGGDVLTSNSGSEYTPTGYTFLENVGLFQKPVFDVYSGQSNSVLSYTDNTVVIPRNLFIWNWNGTPGSVGTAFVAPSQQARWALSAAIKKANADQTRNFYILNVGYGSQPIEQWLPSFANAGPGYYDMAAALEDNIDAALAWFDAEGIPITTVSNMHYWGGESNAYDADTESFLKGLLDELHDRWRGMAWFPYQTPMYFQGLSPFDVAFPKYSRWIQEWCDTEFQTRHFVDTSILESPDWDPVPHMSADGYHHAGEMTTEAQLGRTAQAPFSSYTRSGTFTPGISIATPGDLSVSYAIQNGVYTRIGPMVYFTATIRFTPTFTTASGNLSVTGLPFNVTSAGYGPSTAIGAPITKTNYTSLAFIPTGSAKTGLIQAFGSGQAESYVAASNITTAVQVTLKIAGQYQTGDWFGA